MRFTTYRAVPFFCLLLVAACSSKSPEPAPPAATVTPPASTLDISSESSATGASREGTITRVAIVDAVDVDARTVTLRGPEGDLETIHVGPEVKNLPQVRKGDQVSITYYRSVAFEVVDPKDKSLRLSDVEGEVRNKLGEKPGGIRANVVAIVADVVKLDRANQTAVLKGPNGESMTVDVRNPENFDKVKVGDRVEIVLTESLAVEVKPATAAH